MNTKVIGKSLLSIVSLVVLAVSLLFILYGIYVESTQQNGAGYELAFVSLIVFALALWVNMSARKSLNALRSDDGIQGQSRKKGNSDAPMLRTSGDADNEQDMPRLRLSSEEREDEHARYDASGENEKWHDHVTHIDPKDHTEHVNELQPSKWWYADNREEPTLSFAKHSEEQKPDKASRIMVHATDDDLYEAEGNEVKEEQKPAAYTVYSEPEDEPGYRYSEPDEPEGKVKHGWFGFDEYEEPEWVEEEDTFDSEQDEEDLHEDIDSHTDEKSSDDATLQDGLEDEHQAKGIEEPVLVHRSQPVLTSNKPRIRVTANVQNSTPKD